MTIGTKEHDEIMKKFEELFSSYRLDKEEKALWFLGQVYQSGEVNKLFAAFSHGYAFGRIEYLY